MCGLVGWISAEKGQDAYDRRKFIDQALILDTVRGGDSTGVFVVPHEKPKDPTAPWPNWRKQVSGGHEFVITKEYRELFEPSKTMDYKYCVGHNRSATIGGISLDTAHPFQEGPITLVHNGTVVKEHTTEIKLANDSHGICWRLSKEEPEAVIKELDGAFALIWHDARDDSLNFVRNAQRPLHMAKATGSDTVYFASEAEMLFWLDKRLGLKLQDIVSMKTGHWVKFNGPKLMIPTVKKVEMYSPPKAQSQVNYRQQDWSGTGGSMSGYGATSYGTATNTSYATGQRTSTKSHKPGKKVKYATDVPQQLQEDLLEYGLLVDSPEDFIPMSEEIVNWKSHCNESSSVQGWLMPTDKTYNPIPAIIHGLNPYTFKNNGRQTWSVIPLGVMWIGWNLPQVVCRLKSVVDTSGNIRSLPASAMPPPIGPHTKYQIRAVYTGPVAEKEEEKETDEDPMFPGPDNRSYTKSEWLRATAEGCGDCGKPLTTNEDAWNLEWIKHDMGYVPICAGCIEDRTIDGGDVAEENLEDLLVTKDNTGGPAS